MPSTYSELPDELREAVDDEVRRIVRQVAAAVDDAHRPAVEALAPRGVTIEVFGARLATGLRQFADGLERRLDQAGQRAADQRRQRLKLTT